MKKILFFLLLFFIVVSAFPQIKKVAIPIVLDKKNVVSNTYKLMIRISLTKAISNQNGFMALDRANVDAIINEINFGESGRVKDEERQKLGNMYGANYICISEVSSENNDVVISASIIEIETGQVLQGKTDYVFCKLDANEIDINCKKIGRAHV